MRMMVTVLCGLLAIGLLGPLARAGEEVCKGEPDRKEGWRDGDKSDALHDKEIREMVTTVMMVRMSRELELNDEQTVLMVRNFTTLRDHLTALSEERDALVGKLRDAVKTSAPDAELQPVLDQLMAVDSKREQARREAYEKAGTNLSVMQRAKLYIFIQDFEGHLRRLVQRARELGSDKVMRWREEGMPPAVAEGLKRRGAEGEHPGKAPGDGPRPDVKKPSGIPVPPPPALQQ
ncbi:MAG: hypothetical protein IT364_03060 [Candidatus Hydrogenedentes bacterium]|nr:hypothetical protein [Candidatus Hydrogenedentota bacterium]